MTKKKKITIICASITFSLACAATGINLATFLNSDHSNPDQGIIAANTITSAGIKFANYRTTKNDQGHTVITVGYSLGSEDANLTGFDTYLQWYPESVNSIYFEEENWHLDKDVKDYVTYNIDYENQEIAFTSVEAFGTSMIFTMQSKSQVNTNASISIDYTRVITRNASANIVDTFSDGEKANINFVSPIYTVGSYGEKHTDCTLSAEYFTDSGLLYSGLFDDLDSTKYNAESVKYKDKLYTRNKNNSEYDLDDLRTDIENNVDKYIKDVLLNDIVFSETEFKSLLTFESKLSSFPVYIMYEGTYASFLSTYSSYVKSGSGYKLTVKNGETILDSKLMKFNIDAKTVNGITVDCEEIYF